MRTNWTRLLLSIIDSKYLSCYLSSLLLPRHERVHWKELWVYRIHLLVLQLCGSFHFTWSSLHYRKHERHVEDEWNCRWPFNDHHHSLFGGNNLGDHWISCSTSSSSPSLFCIVGGIPLLLALYDHYIPFTALQFFGTRFIPYKVAIHLRGSHDMVPNLCGAMTLNVSFHFLILEKQKMPENDQISRWKKTLLLVFWLTSISSPWPYKFSACHRTWKQISIIHTLFMGASTDPLFSFRKMNYYSPPRSPSSLYNALNLCGDVGGISTFSPMMDYRPFSRICGAHSNELLNSILWILLGIPLRMRPILCISPLTFISPLLNQRLFCRPNDDKPGSHSSILGH